MKSRADELRELYEKETGRSPEARFPDDPDWQYRGGKAEFEELQRSLGLGREDGSPVKIEGQEELFDE